MELSWGRRFLMCPPEHFGILYEINPWMDHAVRVDPDLATSQWERLVATLREAGAEVEILPPVEGLPDLVFTANAGLVNGNQFVPSRFRHPERQGETPHNTKWFSERGFVIQELPEGVSHEGAGDALPFGGSLLSAYKWRSDAEAQAHLSRMLGASLRAIELVDERLYHLDITFCPLDDRRAMVAAFAWDDYSRLAIPALVPEPLVIDEDEAFAFTCNSVVVGRTVVMPTCPPRVGRQLEAWGFTPVEVDVGEFLKAGGGCRCLTLALDVSFGLHATTR